MIYIKIMSLINRWCFIKTLNFCIFKYTINITLDIILFLGKITAFINLEIIIRTKYRIIFNIFLHFIRFMELINILIINN